VNNRPKSHNAAGFTRALIKLTSPLQLKPEERHRRIPAIFILIACVITMVIFSPYHLFSGNYLISAADIVALIASVISLIYLRRAERGIAAYWLISLVFITICIITIVLGRKEISYFLWAFVPPAVIFSVLGKKAGMTISLMFFAVAIILMAAPASIMHSEPYSVFVIGRFITIYMILTFMLYYYESSQQILLKHIRNEKEKFECASKQDPLTGLSNRRDLMDKIREEQQRQMRLKNTFTLILGDIDNFKALNDTHGHDAGDHVLKSVAQVLKEQVRGIDCPARWGGEEFLIMLIETDIEGGQTVAERIRCRIEESAFTFNGITLPVTMTFGLSQYQGANDTLDSCIKRADKALYAGKDQGKNRVIIG
jgi:diguanylate cyclase (GGDEF)-like protein